MGFPILDLGRSILAGCKRSTHLARVYTLRAVKELDEAHPQVSIGQHVDDISNLVIADSSDELVGNAVRFARHFVSIIKKLKMEISSKSIVVPNSGAAKRIASILENIGIPLKTGRQGVDIGVDTSSAATRATAKQQERLNDGSKKAKRSETLSRKNSGARELAITGVQPTQTYGITAIGMAPTSTNKAKANVAKATGLMAAGTCATSVIKWAFRKGRIAASSADPRVRIPTEQIKAWTGMWNRASVELRARLRRAWVSTYAKLQQAKSKWQCVRGPSQPP